MVKPGYFDKEGVPLKDVREWSKLFEDDMYRVIAREDVGKYLVSTVWLGLDHNFSDEGPPLIFETMVFSNPVDNELLELGADREEVEEYTKRHSTRQEAWQYHMEVVRQLRGELHDSI